MDTRRYQIVLLSRLFFFIVLALISTCARADGRAQQARPPGHFRDCTDCPEMIVIPTGSYMMGATAEEFRGQDPKYQFMYAIETPRHEVHVKSFAMAKFDVTRGQFSVFAKETGFDGKGCHVFKGNGTVFDRNADWQNPGFLQTDSDPVVCVSWNDTQKYIAWLNSRLGRNAPHRYRLPFEEEWEYAARAGTVTATYWGNNPSDQCRYENTRDQSARVLDPTASLADCTDGYVYTAPVGSFRPNPWGLFDMLGNAEEWVEDCASIGYGLPPDVANSDAELCRQVRGLRGASWASIPMGVRSAGRSGGAPDMRKSIWSFRLAASVLN